MCSTVDIPRVQIHESVLPKSKNILSCKKIFKANFNDNDEQARAEKFKAQYKLRIVLLDRLGQQFFLLHWSHPFPQVIFL